MPETFIFRDRKPIKKITIIHPDDLMQSIKVKDCKLKTLEYNAIKRF